MSTPPQQPRMPITISLDPTDEITILPGHQIILIGAHQIILSGVPTAQWNQITDLERAVAFLKDGYARSLAGEQ